MISILSLTILLFMILQILQYKLPRIFPKMLSFPKSHKIEEMIIFQFAIDNKIEGYTQAEFLSKIQHRLILNENSIRTNTTEILETPAPCSTLN